MQAAIAGGPQSEPTRFASSHRQKRHAIDRAFERHGLVLTLGDLKRAVVAIIAAVAGDQPPPALLLQRHSSGIEQWLVPLGGQNVRVVYDPCNGFIRSVLPDSSRGYRLADKVHGTFKNVQHKQAGSRPARRAKSARATDWVGNADYE